MKKLLCFSTFITLLLSSCMQDIDEQKSYSTQTVRVQLEYPAGTEYSAKEGVQVRLTNSTNGSVFDAATDASGLATFDLTPGVYNTAVTDKRVSTGVITIFNGTVSGTKVTDTWNKDEAVKLALQASTLSQLVIKELYFGGCRNNANSGSVYMDKYVILFNNSDTDASLDNLCLGMTIPLNATMTNNADEVDGKLLYDLGDDSWLPAGYAFWTFGSRTEVVKPGEQVVVALNSANDLTVTYSNSVDLSNPAYYAAYDPADYSNATLHPAPSSNIPTSHYLTVPVKLGTAASWPMSNASPAFFIFMPPTGTDLQAFAANPDNQNNYNNLTAQPRFKIPAKWVLDGVEVFKTAAQNNKKRLLSTVDAGSVYFTNQYGHTVYRNVDAEATLAIEGNADKIVYNYAYGTTDIAQGTTDESGIDAEASIKNGARIIYKDTNNSTADFHMRSQASLRD